MYSVHNQWLQVVLSTGLIGFVLFLTALALLLRNARGAYSLVAGCALLPAFVLAVTERPWPIDSLELLVWTVPAALLSYPAIKRRANPWAAVQSAYPSRASMRRAPRSNDPVTHCRWAVVTKRACHKAKEGALR